MIDISTPHMQRSFCFNATLEQAHSVALTELARQLGTKRVYVVLFAADVLGEELQENPGIALDIKSRYTAFTESRNGKRDYSFDLKSQLSVPASWFDPGKEMLALGVPKSFTYGFAAVSLLDALESIDDTARGYLVSQIKSFCERYSQFAISKVKSRHFLLSKMARFTEAPAHRGFTAYDPKSFKNS